MRIWLTTAVLATSVGVGALLAWPSKAPALVVPGFGDAICHAKPPRVSMAWANQLHPPAPGSVIRVAAAAISNEDQAEMLLKLGLLEGHLLVGRELLAAGNQELAIPHFGHPVRELYDDIGPEMTQRGITQFDGDLLALEALAVGKPKDPAFQAQYDKVMNILAAVRATVPASLMQDERFTLGVLGEVTAIGAEDYNESIENGVIEKPVEYHDSRGYLEYVDRELKRMEARPDLKGSPRLIKARAALTEMQAIVGTLMPPKTPRKTPDEYRAIVRQFKDAATGA